MVEALAGLPGVRAGHRFPDHRGRPYPTVVVYLDPDAGLVGSQVIEQLLAGDPSIAIMSYDDPQIVRADVRILSDAEVAIVARQLRTVPSRGVLTQSAVAV